MWQTPIGRFESRAFFGKYYFACFVFYLFDYINEWSSGTVGKGSVFGRERTWVRVPGPAFCYFLNISCRFQCMAPPYIHHTLKIHHHQIISDPDPAPNNSPPWWTLRGRLHWIARWTIGPSANWAQQIATHTPRLETVTGPWLSFFILFFSISSLLF